MKVLPVKFESILRNGDLIFGPLILKVDEDLRRFRRLATFGKAQGAGTLAVVQNPPGMGKTTAAYAASSLLKDLFRPVLPVPPPLSLPLRDIPHWLQSQLPSPSEKTTLVLVDGRESTDDDQGLQDVMGALNNLVRGRPDLLFVWPTTSEAWRDRLVHTARDFGSMSLCPEDAVFSIAGPDRSQWVEAVGLVLDQLGSNWDEFGINESTASEIVDDYSTLGDFLTAINLIRVEQEDFYDDAAGLPEVVFVVSSHSQVVGDVARLRNPATYRLRTDELIGSARQSAAGKFWIARGANQKTNLAWVSSLLQVKLVALTPSTVAHACGLDSKPDSRLRDAIVPLDFKPNRGTGKTAFKTTDLARFVAGEPVPEVLSTNKGKTKEPTVEAYDEVQKLSSRQHRDINEAILKFTASASGAFEAEDVQYEIPLGDDAIVDAIVPIGDRRFHMEFHHVSGKHCSPNTIAKYIMGKLKVYAIQYNLIDR